MNYVLENFRNFEGVFACTPTVNSCNVPSSGRSWILPVTYLVTWNLPLAIPAEAPGITACMTRYFLRSAVRERRSI